MRIVPPGLLRISRCLRHPLQSLSVVRLSYRGQRGSAGRHRLVVNMRAVMLRCLVGTRARAARSDSLLIRATPNLLVPVRYLPTYNTYLARIRTGTIVFSSARLVATITFVVGCTALQVKSRHIILHSRFPHSTSSGHVMFFRYRAAPYKLHVDPPD